MFAKRIWQDPASNAGGQLWLWHSSREFIGNTVSVKESTGRAKDISCCTVSFHGSVKGPQGAVLLQRNLPVDSEFGAVCSSLSTLQFLSDCTDAVVDPRSRLVLCDRPGLQWGMLVAELLHQIVMPPTQRENGTSDIRIHLNIFVE